MSTQNETRPPPPLGKLPLSRRHPPPQTCPESFVKEYTNDVNKAIDDFGDFPKWFCMNEHGHFLREKDGDQVSIYQGTNCGFYYSLSKDIPGLPACFAYDQGYLEQVIEALMEKGYKYQLLYNSQGQLTYWPAKRLEGWL